MWYTCWEMKELIMYYTTEHRIMSCTNTSQIRYVLHTVQKFQFWNRWIWKLSRRRWTFKCRMLRRFPLVIGGRKLQSNVSFHHECTTVFWSSKVDSYEGNYRTQMTSRHQLRTDNGETFHPKKEIADKK